MSASQTVVVNRLSGISGNRVQFEARKNQVGAYDGPSVCLYDEHGSGIRHRGRLDRILEESDDLCIAPADVHF